MRLRGGQALARQLALEGVDVVFGVPGVHLDYAVDGLATDAPGVRFLATRHEQTATYMADGYARATGRAGVAMVVPGPGALNAASGLATAYACSSRVLLLVGQVPTHMLGEGRGFLHEIPEQTQLLRSLTKWSGLARAPEEVPGLLREAFRQLMTGRPRPVAVELPPDVLAREADVSLSDAVPVAPPPAPDAGQVERAAALLAEAEFPLLWAGHGVTVAGAGSRVTALAERLGAPIVKSWFGRSAIDDRHPLVVPTQAAGALLGAADVVLVAGSRFVTREAEPIEVRPGARTIGVNVDAHDLGPPRAYDAVVEADARVAVEALERALPGRVAAVPHADVAARLREESAREPESLEPQMSWLRALRAGLPDDGVLVNDLTQVGFVAEVGYEVRDELSFVTAGYQGTLGFGFPTALGLQAGAPERAVVTLCGDGGFGYALPDLATARQHGLGVVVALFDDGAFGNVRRTQQEQFGGRLLGTRLENPDFVALARSYGIFGARVERPEDLTAVLRERAGTAEPALLVMPQGEVPSPWPLILRGGRPEPAPL